MVVCSPRKIAASLAALLPLLANAQVPRIIPRESPSYNHDFEFPLPIMPVKQPLTSYTNPQTGVQVDFYEIKIKEFTKNLFPDLGDATLIGYDGQIPGPTFRVPKGRETVVRFVNEYYRDSSIHLHGSYSRAPFDGWAEDTIKPGQYKDYYYPNTQSARTLWYHDHAMGITALNAYSGQAGFYILENAALEASLDLPRGAYDIPLMLNSKPPMATPPSVNGQILPHFVVEPRKYRLRVLNAAASRTFNLTLNVDSTRANKKFHVVGSDSGFMSKPVETESLVVAMAERWEIVIDFANLAGQNLTLKQSNCFVDTNYAGYDKVMQFRVGNAVTSEVGNGPLPGKLVDLDLPAPKTQLDQNFVFGRNRGEWTINSVTFSDVNNRILRNVPRGTTEMWRLQGGGGWSHPVHIHLVDFQILFRRKSTQNSAFGRTEVTPYEAAALKDVIVLGNNEAVTVLAKYAPWDGVYMFHCHNLVHEDHDMMGAFNVTALSDFNYPETTRFIDPMEPRFRAKPYKGFTVAEANSALKFFSSLNAYTDADGIESALDQYWANKASAP
ncbi:uncharacterized protein H6S33_009879 [Morchella sextelata]|uniref:uncharacterized protein n=1 Tax=Morchella sextelata TaxID=1174677 RepID=UPI001D04318F|nr:uncharacterized protein H6S33_009879 [Morchella sextelata]KAH0602238.1 hypothetical protein H6S33_009879 [Morchella sextelata]